MYGAYGEHFWPQAPEPAATSYQDAIAVDVPPTTVVGGTAGLVVDVVTGNGRRAVPRLAAAGAGWAATAVVDGVTGGSVTGVPAATPFGLMTATIVLRLPAAGR